MKFTKESLKLYGVTSRQWLNNKPLAQAVEEAIKGGVTFIQLREKNTEYEKLKELALSVKAVTDKYSIPFVINDNVELCIDINADGVHLGADDMSVKKAREILGNDKIIGGTARTLERGIKAYEEGADYLGIGAVFDTSTKAGTTHMSKETALKIHSLVPIPTVAIGGISSQNILSLKGYGISGIAVVSSIFAQEDITSSCIELSSLVNKIL
ncbi:MAG: thiamine phosphate synthase [Clostridia bacterium]|nr:thiamine phosphate synthase [Clostridia bacterium]